MKLTKKNPVAKNKTAEGELSLTNASKIGAHQALMPRLYRLANNAKNRQKAVLCFIS